MLLLCAKLQTQHRPPTILCFREHRRATSFIVGWITVIKDDERQAGEENPHGHQGALVAAATIGLSGECYGESEEDPGRDVVEYGSSHGGLGLCDGHNVREEGVFVGRSRTARLH
ncbi:uncharacterized protein DS421_13g419330 [Arachis hypogaea]|nr:uncharacterized protein DS421_13g419330 [Arachis hypogaea]